MGSDSKEIFTACRELIVYRRPGINREGLFAICILIEDNGLGTRLNKEKIQQTVKKKKKKISLQMTILELTKSTV